MSSDAASSDDLGQFLLTKQAGEFIFRERDEGADMFIVCEGQVELLKQYAGEQRKVADLEAGDFFGEMSLLEERPREVTARAVTRCDLLRIDATTFDRIVQEAPEIPVRMLRKLCRRLREYLDHEARAVEIAIGPLAPVADAHVPETPVSKTPQQPTSDVAAPARQAPARLAPAKQAPHAPVEQPPAEVRSTARVPATSARTPARTAVLVEAASHKEIVVPDRDEVTIGRIDRATGFTPDLDLTAIDGRRTVGRRHARILRRDGDYFLREEIGTQNGTFVDGARLGTGKDCKLADGARVRFGLVEMRFEIRPHSGADS